MKKKVFLALSLVTMLLFAYACAPVTSNQAATEAQSTSDIKVGLVLTGALGDQSVNDQAYAGLMYCQENYGVQVKAVECTDASMYAEAAQKFCEEGYNLVVFNAFNQEEALRTVAPAYPDVNFMLLDTVVGRYPECRLLYLRNARSILPRGACWRRVNRPAASSASSAEWRFPPSRSTRRVLRKAPLM